MSVVDLAYLPLVVEEAAEVIQAAMKIQRFGEHYKYTSGAHIGQTNMEALCLEVGDLFEVIGRMNLPSHLVDRGRDNKRERLKRYGPHVWKEDLHD